MKNFAIGLAVVIALIILWAGLQAIGPKTDEPSQCGSSGGG
ncbi:MAG: hypothetical protein ABFD47_10140 [Armatimonadota bacterium]